MAHVALVTGGNRGIGREVARQLAERGLLIVITVRNEDEGIEAAAELASDAKDAQLVARQLDVTDEQSVRSLANSVLKEFGRVDLLVNNAGVYPDEGVAGLDISTAIVRATFETNLLGPLLLCQSFIPGMCERGFGRVVNVSSGFGRMQPSGPGVLAYRVSKAALNMMTIVIADETRGTGVLVNAADPGWVRTRMGGKGAPRSIEEGADTIVWLATLPDDGPTGGFFHDRNPVSW